MTQITQFQPCLGPQDWFPSVTCSREACEPPKICKSNATLTRRQTYVRLVWVRELSHDLTPPSGSGSGLWISLTWGYEDPIMSQWSWQQFCCSLNIFNPQAQDTKCLAKSLKCPAKPKRQWEHPTTLPYCTYPTFHNFDDFLYLCFTERSPVLRTHFCAKAEHCRLLVSLENKTLNWYQAV